MYTFYRHLLLPAYETFWKRRKTFPYWKELERSQWLSRAELEALQFEALRHLLVHAYEHCPYYREAWKSVDCHPARLQAPSDFERWPLTARETIREHRHAMRAQILGMKLIAKSTGGSSGVPVQFDLDFNSNDR